jgi:eukaryotic-like serine/threonine-protein kinase
VAESDDAKLIAGRYRLITPVGSGGMGTVWRGKDEVLGRTVAVKQLTGHIGVSATLADEAVQRAMREARIAARLHHPNVIGIYDVVEADDRPYLVMEFLASRSLSDIIVQDSTLSVRELARVGSLVAAALIAAHEAGIVHRDVKPGNVLLADDGTVKLTDFGISRAVGDKTVTAAGALVGTVAYMAPEVGLGQVADARSDVYSLGATLYTAIEGEPPSGYDDNPIALLYRIVHEDIKPPERAGELAPVLTWMLKRDPIDRLTMQQAQAALERIAEAPEAGAASVAVLTVPVDKPSVDKAPIDESPAADQAAETPDAEVGTPSPSPSDAAEEGAPEPELEADLAPALVPVPAAASDSEPKAPSDVKPEPEPASEKKPSAVAAALGGRRRQALVGGIAAAVIVLIVVIVVLTTSQGGTGNAGATGAQASTSHSAAAASHSPTPAQSPSSIAVQAPVTSAAASPSSSPSPSQTQDLADQLTSTIIDYYHLMPTNLSEGWTWLTASYQAYPAEGWTGYTSYWNSMQSVSVSNVTADPPSSVTATITYYEKNGTVTTEITEFGLVMQDGQWKINTSEVIG